MAVIEPLSPLEQQNERALLRACQADIVTARLRLQEARHQGRRVDAEPFREDLVAALQEYAAMIARSGAPMPRRLGAELVLYQNLGHRP